MNEVISSELGKWTEVVIFFLVFGSIGSTGSLTFNLSLPPLMSKNVENKFFQSILLSEIKLNPEQNKSLF